MTRAGLFAVSLVAALAAASGCTVDEDATAPVESFKQGEGGGPLGPSDAGPSETDAAPPKRTVLHRNPFGNVAKTENLLWDGDFEMSSPFSDEYGWLTGPPFSYAFSGVKIGAECRSGIKCAVLPKKKYLVAIGVGSLASKLEASVWVRPAAPSCDDVEVTLTSLSNEDADVVVPAVAAGPDDTGYCHYDVIADQRQAKTYLAVHNVGDADAIVDDASLERVPDAKALTAAIGAPTAAQAASLAVVREGIAATRGPHDAPPNAARRALESWTRR